MDSKPLRLLMVIPSLPVGGAEWAFVRLANALSTKHEVTAYVPWACDSSPALLRAFENQVRLVSLPFPHSWFHRVIYKFSLLFPKLAMERRIHRWVLGLLHRLERFQIVNSHLHSGTRLACDAFAHASVPVVETDHGDYALLEKEDASLESHRQVFARLDGMICLSKANVARIQDMPWKAGFMSEIIPNPVPGSSSTSLAPDAGSPFTFGLLARGIPAKGWAEALAAFRLLRKQTSRPVKLLFIGDGPEIQRLKTEVLSDEGVEFAGHQADPSSWIAKCHVGLLPSYFTAESLPNAIIEFQSQGRPFIATEVGGIPEMLEGSGILVSLDSATGRADVTALASAMQRMMDDAGFCTRCAEAAGQSFLRYLPEKVCAAYGSFFASMTSH